MSVHILSAKLLFLLFAIVHYASENEQMTGMVLFGVLGFVFVYALGAAMTNRSIRYVIIDDAIRLREADRFTLRKQNDDLRIRIDELSKRLAHDQEYRRQLTQNTQLEERNRIAQEIHDHVGHTISGSLMQLEAARVILEKDPDKVETIIVGVIRNLREGLERIRQTLKNIKPGSTTLGINRIRLMLDDFSARYAIKTKLESAGELTVIDQHMWRVIQENLSEALTNTVRHGSANIVRVWIRILNKLIRVEIRDDGVGCQIVQKGGCHAGLCA